MNKNEIVELLKKYKERQAKLDLKRNDRRRKEIQLEILKEEEYKISLTPGYSEGGKGNCINSKVENAVVKKDSDIETLEKEIIDLNREIELLEIDVKEIDIRLGMLTYLEKEILVDYLINEMTYTEIGNITYYRLRQQTRGEKAIRTIIKKALSKLEKI